LPRPHADTLAGDPARRAILLCAANKQGRDSRKFYAELIATADARFGKYL
jgi:hypothetical protein